ncbi:MAG TPA: HAMP domain-containing sensor histidine kinase [Steroidobacteraceae bacterium]|nr:HAMP domain-containing sensor histidine kinase [Steroidobacteraceae bacterium]
MTESLNDFHTEVAQRCGILPNFFRSAQAAPELIQQLWGFAKAGYLDNPMPAVFKERLFVWLSRFCPMRYCIVRHVGFLLGRDHGHSAGDVAAIPQTVPDVVHLLRRPTPWQRDMALVYARLENLAEPIENWPDAETHLEDDIFACAAAMFVEPARSERARHALTRALGSRRLEFFSGCLAFIRTAHYWTMLHPEIEIEEDMVALLREQEELAKLLIEDPEADRCEMGDRLFDELTALRDLHERQELQKAKQALEEKDRQKDQFIAALAHELRNPLATIRSSADALTLMRIPDERVAQLVQRLDRQTTAMKRMLDDLLDVSRLALGKLSVHMEPVGVQELLSEVLDEHRGRIGGAGLSLEIAIDGAACSANVDRVRLRQVMDNLFANAVKFTPAGGTIHLSLAREGALCSIRVRDTGVGFDQKFAAELFEPFMQAEQSVDRPNGGLGLGLAIASRLATLQGGSLTAVSQGLQQGATFTLQLPLVG